MAVRRARRKVAFAGDPGSVGLVAYLSFLVFDEGLVIRVDDHDAVIAVHDQDVVIANQGRGIHQAQDGRDIQGAGNNAGVGRLATDVREKPLDALQLDLAGVGRRQVAGN